MGLERSGMWPLQNISVNLSNYMPLTNIHNPSSWRGGKGGQGPRRQGSGPKDRTGAQDRRDNRLQTVNREPSTNKTQEKSSRGPTAVVLPQETHNPVNKYNAQEVEEALKLTPNMKNTFYRSAPSSTELSKAKGPWASKRNGFVWSTLQG